MKLINPKIILNKGFEHLLTYFNTVKSDYINNLLNTINSIELSYKESYKRNMNMLSFIKMLIDNYDGSIKKKNSILNHWIIIY